ncbi:MAG: orotidine-5'-phosphate decarboxylase, partial [Myxococcales bacterium]
MTTRVEDSGRQAARERLILALDVPDWASAEPLAEELAGEVGWLKVGLELFVREGPAVVAEARRRAPVFLDLKLHDIPATMERAVASAAASGAGLLTVHAASGGAALEGAVRRCE